MDKYLQNARSNLRLAQLTLGARLVWIERQPKGMSFRYNQIRHTKALAALIDEVMAMSELDDQGWWEHDDLEPF